MTGGDPAPAHEARTIMDRSEKIWQEYHARLRAFVKRRISDDCAVDDVLQDVFLKMHVSLNSLKDEAKLQSWLYQIARNAVVDHYRSQKPFEEIPEWISQPEPDPAEEPRRDYRIASRRWCSCCRKPTARQSSCRNYEGLTQKEVARLQGITLSGAKSRVQRGRGLLKNMLTECCRAKLDHGGRLSGYEPEERACDAC